MYALRSYYAERGGDVRVAKIAADTKGQNGPMLLRQGLERAFGQDPLIHGRGA